MRKPSEKSTDSPPGPGHGALEVQFVAGQSTLTGCRSANPLKLLAPRARGQSVWVYTSSFGGGLVAGDQTRLGVHVGANSRCFLGTQAATKIYRNPRRQPCAHQTLARIETNALLVFAPDPVQPFAESSYVQRQEFRLSRGANLILLDWFTAGRVARQERWQFQRLHTRNSVYAETMDGEARSEEIAFIDSVLLRADDSAIASQHRTGKYQCFATLLVLGPLVAPVAAGIVAAIEGQAIARQASLLTSVSRLRDGAVLRVAGADVEAVAHELHRHLGGVPVLLGDDPWARKW